MIPVIGRLKLEYDGSVVIVGQIVGKFAVDGMTPEEIDSLNADIVRRWNHFEGV